VSNRAVIVSAVRTPFGKLGGALADKPATELGSIAIRAALERIGLAPDEVEYAIMGQVLQAGAGQAPARQAAIGAGIPKEVGADTINKVCASSIRAVEMAYQMIRAGDHEVIVTGTTHTDADAVHLSRAGIPTGLVSICQRHTHMPVEMIDLADVEACVRLLVAFTRRGVG